VLERLESAGVPTLAIKADVLSGIKTTNDLTAHLGLPATVEEIVRFLGTEEPVIVLLDQLDALSLALTRDQATLTVMLTTLAHLRELPNVRILASCRTFDLHHDPRLSTIKVDRKFTLKPLPAAEVNRVVQAFNVDPARLLPEHQRLLTVPLHLSIYAQVMRSETIQGTLESFCTLQDLYAALWQRKIGALLPEEPTPAERSAALYLLVDDMVERRQLTAPVALLDEHAESAHYLEREGFIRSDGRIWQFTHQTLLDYCYARRFVAQRDKSLSREVLDSAQGLFERSLLLQVMAYLRASDKSAYHRELRALLFAANLRPHLRLLLLQWFGGLDDITADEQRVAQRLLNDAERQLYFLAAARSNIAWFDVLNDGAIARLMHSDNPKLVEATVAYLRTLIQARTSAVVALLRRYLGASEIWDNRITFCLVQLAEWESEEALDLLCDVLQCGTGRFWSKHCFHYLATSNPAAGCRALRVYLDRRLDELLTAADESVSSTQDWALGFNTFGWDRTLFEAHEVDELLDAATHYVPEALLEHLLPWLLRILEVVTSSREDKKHYASDPLFAWGWHHKYSNGAKFARQIAAALSQLAKTHPAAFRAIAVNLMPVESLAAQRILMHAYLSAPQVYADDIFAYLMADARRWDVDEANESYLLVGAAFCYNNVERRAILEQRVLTCCPDWEKRDLRARGITQLSFLKCIPPDLLSGLARDWRGVLERKFPDFQHHASLGSVGGFIGSPIEVESQTKMSDAAWLSAMRKYSGNYEHPDFLKGGAEQLATSLQEQVKAKPERFYRLTEQFDATIPYQYLIAVISGLADSTGPAEWLFDLVRRFTPLIPASHRREICWALDKRATDGVPDDLLDLLTDWALHDPDPVASIWPIHAGNTSDPYDELHSRGINSNRGAALRAMSHCAWKRTPPPMESIVGLLGQVADDPSTVVRACVVEVLGPLLVRDEVRTIAIFERALEGHPALLQSPLTHRFLYWIYRSHFSQVRSLIEQLLTDEDSATRQAGARLVCLAAFDVPEALPWAERALQGDAAMRLGAAQVYARNLEHPKREAVCQERLLRLMHDTDDQVRAEVGRCFQFLRPEHLIRLRPLIEQFVTSPALAAGADHLVTYLAPLTLESPDLTLDVAERILEVFGNDMVDIRKAAAVVERDVVQIPLLVYRNTLDPAEQSRAMDLFDRLLLLGSRTAHQALGDWDRR